MYNQESIITAKWRRKKKPENDLEIKADAGIVNVSRLETEKVGLSLIFMCGYFIAMLTMRFEIPREFFVRENTHQQQILGSHIPREACKPIAYLGVLCSAYLSRVPHTNTSLYKLQIGRYVLHSNLVERISDIVSQRIFWRVESFQ